MAKYFSTPSKGCHTQYGEEQNCHARGEKTSMERLLTEVSGTPAWQSLYKELQSHTSGPRCRIANVLASPPSPPPLSLAADKTSTFPQ